MDNAKIIPDIDVKGAVGWRGSLDFLRPIRNSKIQNWFLFRSIQNAEILSAKGAKEFFATFDAIKIPKYSNFYFLFQF